MIVDPRTTDGAAYITECLKASRTPQLFFKMVHRDGNGNITSSHVYDTSQIKSYKISDSICNNSDYSVGNVPNMEFECEVFNSTDDTENVAEIEVFFNPFDDASATVRQDIENTTVGNAPSNPHTARIATFYCTGAYFYEGLMVFRGVDAVGLHTNAYWPDSDGLTYPVTGRQMLNSALLWGGFKTIPSSQSFVNLDDITFTSPPDGYTVRQVLEILCTMEGANLVHVNDFRSSGGVEYDFKVIPMYPGRYTYASLAGRSLPEMWAYDTNPASYVTIHDSNIFNIKRLQKPIVFAGVQYAGTYYDGSTAPNGSTYYLEIPQNEMLNDMKNADLAVLMNRLADIYKGWNYFPVNMTCVSVPFVQDFDRMFLPGQNVIEAVVTSTNLTGLGSETIVTAGNTVPMNDYRYAGRGVSRYDKNAAMINRLYKFFYPSASYDNIGLGGNATGNSETHQFTNWMDTRMLGRTWFDGNVFVKDGSFRNINLNNTIYQRSDSVNMISTAGWYRIFECDFANLSNALGTHPQLVEIVTRSSSASSYGSIHSIQFKLLRARLSFIDEISNDPNSIITKIRYNTDDATGKGFIDILINPNGSQYFSASLIAKPYQYLWKPTDFLYVAESPTGETTRTFQVFLTSGTKNGVGLEANFLDKVYIAGETRLNSDLRTSGDAYFGGEVFDKNNYNIDIRTHVKGQASVTGSGWKRIAHVTGASNGTIIGIYAFGIDIAVSSSFDHNNNAFKKISLIATYNNVKFVDETSVSNYNQFFSIRYMTTSGADGYIDVYYNSSSENTCMADFVLRSAYLDGNNSVKVEPVAFESVGPAPSGETVRAEYTFQANTSLDRCYNSGDTGYSYGYSVGAIETQDTIGFSVKTSKEFRYGGGNVTFTRLKLSAMGTNGRIDANGWNTEYVGRSGYSYTGTIANSSPGLLYIQLKKTSGNFTYVSGGSAVTNYTPVTVWGDIAFTVTY